MVGQFGRRGRTDQLEIASINLTRLVGYCEHLTRFAKEHLNRALLGELL